jgi:hypothetical protein
VGPLDVTRLHHVYLKDGIPYLDDMPLKGVQDLSIHFDVHGRAECQISMLITAGEPTVNDYTGWIKQRAVNDHEWKKMMTEKAQDLLDGLS